MLTVEENTPLPVNILSGNGRVRMGQTDEEAETGIDGCLDDLISSQIKERQADTIP
jgi:hypothetical protein